MAGKRVNNIRAIARQPPITTIQKQYKDDDFCWVHIDAILWRPQGDWGELRELSCGIFAGQEGSWRISTVNIRYKETAVENTKDRRKFSVCSSDL
jgi:hypothetical protein